MRTGQRRRLLVDARGDGSRAAVGEQDGEQGDAVLTAAPGACWRCPAHQAGRALVDVARCGEEHRCDGREEERQVELPPEGLEGAGRRRDSSMSKPAAGRSLDRKRNRWRGAGGGEGLESRDICGLSVAVSATLGLNPIRPANPGARREGSPRRETVGLLGGAVPGGFRRMPPRARLAQRLSMECTC
jgi:hypothetical protein